MSDESRPAAPQPESDPLPPEPADVRAAWDAVDRLVRLHNLLLVAVIGSALAALAILQATRSGITDPTTRLVLVVLRVVFPVAALAGTSIYTMRTVRRLAQREPAAPVTLTDVTHAFGACKRISMALLTAAGLFASLCLAFGNRVIDLILAVVMLLLLLTTRPSRRALLSFAGLAQSLRDDLAPAGTSEREHGADAR